MKSLSLAALVSIALLVGGCASTPQVPVALGPDAVSSTNTRIGIAMNVPAKPDTVFPGASCLLCMGVVSLANSSLTSYTQTLSRDDLLPLKDQLAAQIHKKGPTVIVIPDPIQFNGLPDFPNPGPNIFKKDVSSLRSKYGVDKLLVVQIDTLGMVRTYSAYFPTSEPKATIEGVAYIVNLNSNAYEWYLPLHVVKSADGPWDEAPKFPGLTNAYYQVVESTKDEVLGPFGK
jgi:hypothetical protein